MKKIISILIISIILSGCGLIPGGGRFFSDYHRASQYVVSGASKTRVRMDWGKPDKILKTEKGESWVYSVRQDAKTFTFNFDSNDRLISTNID